MLSTGLCAGAERKCREVAWFCGPWAQAELCCENLSSWEDWWVFTVDRAIIDNVKTEWVPRSQDKRPLLPLMQAEERWRMLCWCNQSGQCQCPATAVAGLRCCSISRHPQLSALWPNSRIPVGNFNINLLSHKGFSSQTMHKSQITFYNYIKS